MLVTLGLVALAVFAIDQTAKFLVTTNLTLGEDVHVLGDVLILHYVKNPGAAFSLASGSTWIFSIIAACVVVAVIWFSRRIRSTAWGVFFGLLLGGTLGNLFDRLFREPSFGLGHVVDFLFTPWLLPAIYNVADIAICTAMALFVLLSVRGVGLDGTRERAGRDEQDQVVSENGAPAAPGAGARAAASSVEEAARDADRPGGR
ncbi:signal peptidase II [Rathayibacter sp. AY1E6]|uniref:signal peptidase II n=1 Tax=Rathayibacter sp. AY1E6 TaxID=2080554 RepID=UPI000CE92620|nr:signal peptidase II [Rathayibacter sp. AY1E6]PPF74312.1 signal peptidase II [Rathayibacter sp. AY1E6]